jgi:hypothetical protein
LRANRTTAASLHGGESGVGAGLRAVESGRAIRVLSVVDAYTRECLWKWTTASRVDASRACWRGSSRNEVCRRLTVQMSYYHVCGTGGRSERGWVGL